MGVFCIFVKTIDMEEVYVIESTYSNGKTEVNAVYSDKKKAEEFQQWMKDHPLDDVSVVSSKIYNFCVI